jgi:hypothetical protein
MAWLGRRAHGESFSWSIAPATLVFAEAFDVEGSVSLSHRDLALSIAISIVDQSTTSKHARSDTRDGASLALATTRLLASTSRSRPAGSSSTCGRPRSR